MKKIESDRRHMFRDKNIKKTLKTFAAVEQQETVYSERASSEIGYERLFLDFRRKKRKPKVASDAFLNSFISYFEERTQLRRNCIIQRGVN
ncbi:hypothetical protein TNIN_291111 [Trichonephila inaurata madagascariensis]|uniref:Uncharacterized protein n=1 Tax=Trichonephila inaurata madagascariensis TaxID=2747483 RepID=A0A8X7BMF2_9ARAC|nr:hypothetical protein TNIN_291111 [Trichonephila inaurata madagascariensis]